MSQATTAQRVGAEDIAVRPAAPARSRARALRPFLMIGGIVIVAIGAGAMWLAGGRYVSVSDSYIQADKLAVSTDVSGIVQQVDVHEGQAVAKGQVLFRIDPSQFQIALDGAKASLAQTELDVEALKRDYQRMLSDTAVKQAETQNDQITFNRYSALVRGGSVTRSAYDAARFKLMADQSQLKSLQDQAKVQLARLAGNANIAADQTPQYLAAQAKVNEAARQLRHTVVRAPFAGVVTHVSSLQPGQYLAASTAAFGLVSNTDVWVTAHPKETVLTWVKPGDKANVRVDTYPGRVWHGTVQSISPAAGSEFSILPAQNSSGNWVKVVQRIPLRVVFRNAAGDPPLRAGMTTEVSIDTGHKRTLSDLFSGLF